MNDQQYLDYCRAQLAEFAQTFATRTEGLPPDHPLRELAQSYRDLCEATTSNLYQRGPELVSRLFDTYPEFAPTLPRQLLWFLGGDCLHYMADDEIAQYQEFEDLRLAAAARGEIFSFQDARTRKLH